MLRVSAVFSLVIIGGAPAQAEDEPVTNPVEKLQIECKASQEFTEQAGVETAEEKAARFEADFQNALMMTDKCLRRFTESAAAGGGGGGGGTGGGGQGADGGLKGTDKPAKSTSSGAGDSAAASETETGEAENHPAQTQQNQKSGATPADIPDGRNDDVVARQLRELAEQTSDPALQKKYWNEYRRYIGLKPVE